MKVEEGKKRGGQLRDWDEGSVKVNRGGGGGGGEIWIFLKGCGGVFEISFA